MTVPQRTQPEGQELVTPPGRPSRDGRRAGPPSGNRPSGRRRSAVVVVPELVERDRRAERTTSGTEAVVVVLVIAGHRERRCAGLFGRVHLDIAVPSDAGTRRDELADDHVLLQTNERV